VFETLSACDVEENSECSFSSITIHTADRNDAQIEDLSLWSMCFDFDAAPFDPFETIEKRTVDRWVPSQLSETLRFERCD
jgi:hypothetical protein